MLAGVAEVISFYNMIGPRMSVGLAVSGGADSVCLLDVLVELAPRWNLNLRVLHLDHGLRGAASREDARFVGELAARLGLPFDTEIAQLDPTAANLEALARRSRRDFFLRMMRNHGLDRVALGHTRNDQAETVLYRFLRGSGTVGLAAMRPLTREGFIRPLLFTTRTEVEEYLRSRGLTWRDDATNHDLRFDRNRIRHLLLPELAARWNPAIVETLAGMASLAAEEEEYWNAEVNRTAPTVLDSRPPAVIVDLAQLSAQPRALARRLLRRAVETVKGDLRAIDLSHIEAILALAARAEGSGRLQIPGIDVMRSFDWLRLAPQGAYARPEYSVPVTAPGRYLSPVGEIQIDGAVTQPLELRNWRPGDAYRREGDARERKLKELFQDARVPLWERAGWPVLVGSSGLVWSRRFGPAAGFRLHVEDRP